jgi:DNA-binding response OmpR family regulator
MPARAHTFPQRIKVSLSVTHIEREILRVLCSRPPTRPKRERILRELANHSWKDPEHRVVYDAICRLRNNDARTWQAELPAAATRMGFPDVDWAPYFQMPETARWNVRQLLRELKERS